MEIYKGIESLKEPIIVVSGVEKAMNGDICKIKTEDKEVMGQVISVDGSNAVVEVFSSIKGFDKSTQVGFEGRPFSIGVTEFALGRVFNGLGKPIDGSEIVSEKEASVYGSPINPAKRNKPSDFIQTGISAIDGLNSLVMGQKLPIFSGGGLPHNDLALQIVKNARTDKNTKFAVIFGAMGITSRESDKFMSLLDSPSADRTIIFMNKSNDPIIERLILPRVALTYAEYLAFEKDYNVLVVLTDMLNYSDALRQLSAEMRQIPGRRGYPANLYTDLATIYERCGRIKGKDGSVTLMPILSMPADDITHPVPDLTGYITEGQIVLSRDMFNRKIYPPISIQDSLSRLMDFGVGAGKTREDHRQVANQLYYAFSKGMDARNLSLLIGEGALSEEDKVYLKFLGEFEDKFVSQEISEARDLTTTLGIAWELMAQLPVLPRITKEIIDKYGIKKDKDAAVKA